MGYLVTFYALDGPAFARQLRHASEELLGKVEQPFRRQFSGNESAWARFVELAGRIARGELPEDCEPDYFHALCWLAQGVSERIAIPGYEGFRRLSFFDEIGIWPLLLRHSPPFPVPRAADGYPSVGYLPRETIEDMLQAQWQTLPPSEQREVLNARDDFHDVLESLIPDRLDLLAVLF